MQQILDVDLGHQLEADFCADLEVDNFEVVFLQLEAASCTADLEQQLEAAFYQYFAIDLELQLEAAFQHHLLEVAFLADLDADQLEAALCQAIGQHLEVDF